MAVHKLLIGAAITALATTIAPAVAQTTPAPQAPVAVAPSSPPGPAPGQQVRVRVMSNRVMTRAEVDEHIRKLSARFDTNHDGFITREELASVAQGMMAMHDDMQKRLADRGVMMGDRAAIFDRLDTNHDGSISRQEFMASQPQVHEQRVIVMRDGNSAAGTPQRGEHEMQGMHMFGMGMGGFGGHLFEMADTNHDGRVSLQEAETAALAHFDRADLNHDGKLTPEERQQAHQLMRQHRPS